MLIYRKLLIATILHIINFRKDLKMVNTATQNAMMFRNQVLRTASHIRNQDSLPTNAPADEKRKLVETRMINGVKFNIAMNIGLLPKVIEDYETAAGDQVDNDLLAELNLYNQYFNGSEEEKAAVVAELKQKHNL